MRRESPAPMTVARALLAVQDAERAGLQALRDLADFVTLCRVSDRILAADRDLARARRRRAVRARLRRRP